jgi:hypothetical protein
LSAAAIAVTATAAVVDPILGAIARVDEARRQKWKVAIKPSAEWHAANEALGQAQISCSRRCRVRSAGSAN